MRGDPSRARKLPEENGDTYDVEKQLTAGDARVENATPTAWPRWPSVGKRGKRG